MISHAGLGGFEREKKEGCFSFLPAVSPALCPDTTAEEVIILFLSSMHKHRSRKCQREGEEKGLPGNFNAS